MTKALPEHIGRLLRQWSYASESTEREAMPPKTIWRVAYGYWMRFAKALGKANALLLLTIVYIVLIGPAAIALKIFRKDLLDRKAGESSTYWNEKAQEQLTLERSKQQF
jgi:type II secretory pathway component PulM